MSRVSEVTTRLVSNIPTSTSSTEVRTPREKMIAYIRAMFTEDPSLGRGRPLRIVADSKYLPFVRLMVEEAYRNFNAGKVFVRLIEPEVEALKKKYGIGDADFDYRTIEVTELIGTGGTTMHLGNPYFKSLLTPEEEAQVVESITPKIPPEIQQQLKIDPKEILEGNLSLRTNQPLAIFGEREHMPQILELVEYAYQHGSTLVDVKISENKENDLAIPFYNYASDEVLVTVPKSLVARYQEYLDRNVARIYLDGEDPTQYEGIDPERITKSNVAHSKAVQDIRDQLVFRTPWNIYYLPTTYSAIAAYPEYGDDEIAALEHASREAREINRVGRNEEHIEELSRVADRLNEVLKKGYRTVHFVSVDPETDLSDGKTNFKVGLSEKAVFKAAVEVTPSGQRFIANTPTEEIYTVPDNTKAEGRVRATKPFCLNGVLVENIWMEFKDGHIARDESGRLKAGATANEEMLLEHIERNEGADRLGELSLVAGSPIFDLGRLFKSTLIDENATCHIAIGDGYPECIEGGISIDDPEKQKEYLKGFNFNYSTTHNDFMIGGPNVVVYAEKEDGSQITLIEDNKFVF